MTLKSRLFYDQTANHGQAPEIGLPFRDKIFRGIVEDLESIAATGGGDVYGPASAVDDRIATFDGITGKLIQDGGYTIADLSIGVLLDLYPDAITVDAATTGVLAGAPTYANGAGGVGATLTRGSNGVFPTIDGHSAALNNTYLVKNQATALQNGVYELTTLGTSGTPWVLTRTTNSDQTAEFDPQVVIPANGTVNQRRVYSQTTVTPTVGTSNIVYTQNTTAALVIARTRAQMLALVGSFIPGQLYRITDPAVVQGTCQLLIRAYNNSTLEQTGVGTFINAAMSTSVMAEIEYDLTLNVISRLKTFYRDPGSPVLPVEIINGSNSPIALWPFDSDTISNVKALNPLIIDLAGASLANCDFGDNCSFDLKNSSAIYDTIAKSSVGFSLGSTSVVGIIGCSFGDSCNITMTDGGGLSQCYIGSGKQIDTSNFLTGYYQTGKSYFGNYSDFTVNISQNLNCVETAGVLDMTTFPFCGIIHLDDPGTGTLSTITGFPTDHSFELRADIMGTSSLIIDDGLDNIFLSGGVNATLALNSDDWMSFKVSDRDEANVVETGRMIF